jgi:hypothetical protein
VDFTWQRQGEVIEEEVKQLSEPESGMGTGSGSIHKLTQVDGNQNAILPSIRSLRARAHRALLNRADYEHHRHHQKSYKLPTGSVVFPVVRDYTHRRVVCARAVDCQEHIVQD